jgi:hypothetical protein
MNKPLHSVQTVECPSAVYEQYVLLIKRATSRGGKWKLTKDSKLGRAFFAPIEDSQFLDAVKGGEVAPMRGDLLFVRIREEQTRIGKTLKSKSAVEKVLKFKPQNIQRRKPRKTTKRTKKAA